MACMLPRVLLASSSTDRISLLKAMGIQNFSIASICINKKIKVKELSRSYVVRLATEKVLRASSQISGCAYVVSGSTSAVVGRSILPKAYSDDLVRFCLNKISGRRHVINTGFCVALVQSGNIVSQRIGIASSTVKIKRFSEEEINCYIESKEGMHRCGGYDVRGFMQCFTPFIKGNLSTIVGLPIMNVRCCLMSLGYKF